MLKTALVILSDNDTDAPALPAICTVSKNEVDRGGFTLGVATVQRGGVWLDRPYWTGNPDVHAVAADARRAHQAGAHGVQLGNENNLAHEGWGGTRQDFFDFTRAVRQIAPEVPWLDMPPSPSGDWTPWVEGGNRPKAVHCYGNLNEMQAVVQWYLDNTEGDLYITECNFAAGRNIDNMEAWVQGHFRPFLDWCARHPRIKVVAWFAYWWRNPDSALLTSVNAIDHPGVMQLLQSWQPPQESLAPQATPQPTPAKKYAGPRGDYVRVQMPGGAIQEMEIEGPYLYGVVDQETYDSWGNEGAYEALKAQAVAARSFLRNRMMVRASQPFDVSTTTNDQAWKANPHADAIRAVNETRGEYVWFGEKIANALYFSQADGKTRSYEEAAPSLNWPPNKVPYLVSVDAPGRAPNRQGRHGHGVGMPQWSAYHYARQGWNYRQILQHFYQGITVGTKPEEGVVTTTARFMELLRAEFGDAFRDIRTYLPDNPNAQAFGFNVNAAEGIAVHHTGTNSVQTWWDVNQYHLQADPTRNKVPWHNIAYAVGVSDSGVFLLRNLEQGGNHVYGMNDRLLSVAVLGTFLSASPSSQHLNRLARVIRCYDRLMGEELPVKGHNQWSVAGHGTSCPGPFLAQWARMFRQQEQHADPAQPSDRQWSRLAVDRGTYHLEQLAKMAERGELDMTLTQEQQQELHDLLVTVALPRLYEARSRVA